MRNFKVAAGSAPQSLAGAIAWALRENEDVEMTAIGAAAVNQAIKAVAIARNYLALDEIALCAVPSFATVTKEGEERTALSIVVERRVTGVPAQTEGLAIEAGSGADRTW